jgi:hypothetical protein
MLHPENVPTWLWFLLAAGGIAYGVTFILRRRRERIQHDLREASHLRQVARAKAWRWVYGRPRAKRLSYRPPEDTHHG